jgi:hypothetical protein
MESVLTLDTSEVSVASTVGPGSRAVSESRAWKLAVAPANVSRLAAVRKMALNRMLGVQVDCSIVEM